MPLLVEAASSGLMELKLWGAIYFVQYIIFGSQFRKVIDLVVLSLDQHRGERLEQLRWERRIPGPQLLARSARRSATILSSGGLSAAVFQFRSGRFRFVKAPGEPDGHP